MSDRTSEWVFRCINCGQHYESEPRSFSCLKCGNLLELSIAAEPPGENDLFPTESTPMNVWRYSRGLPFRKDSDPITLGEGGTPLVKSARIGPELGLGNLLFKNEGQNPTGSFKDRGMTTAVTRAREIGAKVLACASTGNTAASLSAYAARAGMKAVVMVPKGKVALGKLAQAITYGARVLEVKGGFDQALSDIRRISTRNKKMYLVNSVNPFRIEGQKTLAFEVYQQLGRRVPDYLVVPVGNAGNISAIWKGFKEMKAWGITDSVPRMVGVQAKGAAPIVDAFEKGLSSVEAWKFPSTVASAIRIGNPVSWMKAFKAIKESGGLCLSVTDEEILKAQKALATKEGIFVEAASAAPVGALRHLLKVVERRSVVVCVATGTGLKEQGKQHPSRSS